MPNGSSLTGATTTLNLDRHIYFPNFPGYFQGFHDRPQVYQPGENCL
jgi:hypothetical protein